MQLSKTVTLTGIHGRPGDTGARSLTITAVSSNPNVVSNPISATAVSLSGTAQLTLNTPGTANPATRPRSRSP